MKIYSVLLLDGWFVSCHIFLDLFNFIYVYIIAIYLEMALTI